MSAVYNVQPTAHAPALGASWDDAVWSQAEVAAVNRFWPSSRSMHPVTEARVLYDAAHLFVQFRVTDRAIIANMTQYQDMVCQDSCVEFFVRPRADRGYFNFELNATGVLLLYYISQEERTETGFRDFLKVPLEWGRQVRVVSSLKGPITEEIAGPLTWQLAFAIPLSLLEAYVGPLGALQGQRWRANFYKCAGDSSLGHWAYWNDVGERLNFHQPEQFGSLRFA